MNKNEGLTLDQSSVRRYAQEIKVLGNVRDAQINSKNKLFSLWCGVSGKIGHRFTKFLVKQKVKYYEVDYNIDSWFKRMVLPFKRFLYPLIFPNKYVRKGNFLAKWVS